MAEGDGTTRDAAAGGQPAVVAAPALDAAAVKRLLPQGLVTVLNDVKAIGPRRAEALLELGIRNVGQLLAHLPMRHEHEHAEASISELVEGSIAAARGEVTLVRFSGGLKGRLNVALVDGTGRLDLVFFNQPYLRQKLHPGMRIAVQGKLTRYGHGLQMANPKWTVIAPSADGSEPGKREERLRPVYPACEAIASADVERCVRAVLEPALTLIEDHLSPAYRGPRELPTLATAYRMMHHPQSEPEIVSARRRLAYDELLLLQLAIAMKRSERAAIFAAAPLPCTPAINKHIRERFPFKLTADQDSVLRDVVRDFGKAVPANRLVQGDVGSGKTAVAVYAMLLAAAHKHQSVLMAPTEILAEQHFKAVTRLLAGSKLRIELLVGALAAGEKAEILRGLASGEVDMVIGTHAVLTQKVAFKSLAVAVIDEQHRFGVHQRAVLRDKGIMPAAGDGQMLLSDAASGGAKQVQPMTPHTLVMTATPIPRTLAMTLFGDLDVSVIRHLPPGRQPIATRVVSHQVNDEVYAFVRKRVDAGEQAYVVVPMIDGSGGGAGLEEGEELVEADAAGSAGVGAARVFASVESVRAELTRPGSPLAGVRLGVVHGRLNTQEREQVMDAFRAGTVDVLLATTVIEVGVDVPNATVMVIEDADRFGLAQLHQLRGRVGRGSKASACVLIADPVTPLGIERLAVMKATGDGFKLAEKDFELRGFGDVLGVRQSGMPPFKVADLAKDMDLLLMARRDASGWIEASPTLEKPDEALVRRRMLKSHGQWLGLADVG
jgi:ATP-dependent DNA helicase RecG